MNTSLPVLTVDSTKEGSKVRSAPKAANLAWAIGLSALILIFAYVGWHWFGTHAIVHTDNAYVQGHVIQITSQVSGTVSTVSVDDTELVRAGQSLVKIDAADARITLEQVESQLAQTVREVHALYVNEEVLSAQVDLRKAEVDRLNTELARAQMDASRRAPLIVDGAVGREELEHANTRAASALSSLVSARAAERASQAQLSANRALTRETEIENHPNIRRAAARVREAHLALRRTEVKAPMDGVVARRSVQVAQRAQAGASLMSLVPLDQIWVDANFKEEQLRRLQIGQPATLVTDLYGRAVRFRGVVAGFGAGTGASFALLPAQNATGNWIKVVQRVPVRIRLDSNEIAAYPLRIGLSVRVSVDTNGNIARPLADALRPSVNEAISAEDYDAEADELVRRVIFENLGRRAVKLGTQAGRTAPANSQRMSPIRATPGS